MRLIITASAALLFLTLIPGAASAYMSPNDPVVFLCENPEAAGYRYVGGRWTPASLSNNVRIKITEDQGEWSVWVKYSAGDWVWTSTDKKPPQGESWFSPKNTFGGMKFDLYIKTRKFSFTDTLGYLTGDTNVTANLIIGQCTPY